MTHAQSTSCPERRFPLKKAAITPSALPMTLSKIRTPDKTSRALHSSVTPPQINELTFLSVNILHTSGGFMCPTDTASRSTRCDPETVTKRIDSDLSYRGAIRSLNRQRANLLTMAFLQALQSNFQSKIFLFTISAQKSILMIFSTQ
jgi:hypothetical protein